MEAIYLVVFLLTMPNGNVGRYVSSEYFTRAECEKRVSEDGPKIEGMLFTTHGITATAVGHCEPNGEPV